MTTYAVTMRGHPQRACLGHSPLNVLQSFLAGLPHGPAGPSHTLEEARQTFDAYAAANPALGLGVCEVHLHNARQLFGPEQ